MEEHKREHRHEHESTESERRQARREEGLEDVGRKGGAAAMAGPAVGVSSRAGVMPFTRDLVRWGPVWAGLLMTLAIQLLLGAIGLAVAVGAYNPTAANYSERVASTLGIWTAVSSLIALFIGGFIAGRMAAVSGLKNGYVQGSLVWALSLVVGVVLSAMGAAGFLGSALNIQPLLTRGVALGPTEATALARSASTGAWWFVVGVVVAWIAAAVGGMLGAAGRYEEVKEEMR